MAVEWAWDMQGFFRTADAEAVRERLGAGADPNARQAGGWTPLHWAARESADLEVVRALVDGGADANARNNAGSTPLHLAAARRAVPGVVDALLGAGADPNARDPDWNMPLHLASGSGSRQAIAALLKAGADANARNAGGRLPADIAARNAPDHAAGVDLEGLQLFAESEDRNAPPHFAGRRDLIGHIERTCTRMRQRERGLTRIVHGAPGAGKTSLLVHLRNVWNGGHFISGGIEGPPPRMILLSASQLARPDTIFASLLGTLDPKLAKRHYPTSRPMRLTGGGVQFMGAGVSVNVERGGPVEKPLQTVSGVAELLPPSSWPAYVVVAIDEAQNLSGDHESPIGKVLQEMHENPLELPLMLVLGGLGNTPETASRLGISRLGADAVHALGSFTPAESKELIAGWGERFGLTEQAAGWQRTMLSIAEECDHWPMHVHNALRAFAEKLVAAQGDAAAVDFGKVRERSDERQVNHYGSRMSAHMDGSEDLLAAAMKDLDERSRRKTFTRSLERHRRPIKGWDLPKNMDEDAFFDHLVHRGALEEALPSGLVRCPIPSFRRHMIGLGDPPPENRPSNSPSP